MMKANAMRCKGARLAALMLAALALGACGQKGPLYLPERTGEVVTRPAADAGEQSGAAQPASSEASAPTDGAATATHKDKTAQPK